MTSKQRKAHIETLKKLITNHNFKIDSYGNYKAISLGREYRIKFMSVNLRIERKSTDRWLNCISKPISQVTPEQLVTWLEKHPIN